MKSARECLYVGAVVVASIACANTASKGATVFGDFEDGTFQGFQYNNGSGGVAYPSSGAFQGHVVTGTAGSSGGLTTKVLDVNASGFSGGVGYALNYSFHATPAFENAFFANNTISFDWEIAPGQTNTGGYAQLYNIAMNSNQGNSLLGGSSASTLNTDAGGGPYNGTVLHVTLNYAAYKTTLTQSSLTYLEFAIQTNNGSTSPLDYYFDNFTLSTAVTPEPVSLSTLGLGVVGFAGRRRRA